MSLMTGKRGMSKAYFRKGYDPMYRRQRKLNKKQKNEVKKIVNIRQELKYFGYNFSLAAITSTAQMIGTPFDVPQGDTDQSRDGDRLMWAGSISLNLQIVNGLGSTADVYNNIRFIVCQWKAFSTGAPTPIVTNILLPGPTGTVDVLSQYNHDTRQNYTILFDKTFTTVGNNGSSTQPYAPNVTTGVLRYTIPLKKARKQVQFQAGGGQGTNRLFIIYVSDSSLATHPQMAFSTKVFFRDG